MIAALRRILDGYPGLGRRAAIVLSPCFVGGAAAYMAAPYEPDRTIVAVCLLASAVFAAAVRGHALARWPAFWALAFALGFVWAYARAELAASPRLERDGAGGLSGVVAWIEAGPSRPRMELRDASFQRYGRTTALKRARVRLASGPRPKVGDRVRVQAVMRPPPAATAPGGYDFQRRAYFDGLGAVGYAIGPLAVDAPGSGGWFALMRARLRDAVYAALPGRPDVAGIIAALTVGDRSGVREADNDALRASGLAHLLAISGLHLGMVAGAIYLVVRLMLALPHGLALRLPAHKVAAVVAIVGAGLYLGLSGAAPPAQRAFVMVVATMFAILTDRLRSGLWFVAWAAVVVTLWSPHVVVGPSFQLSFAAATGIVAAYEALAIRRREASEPDFAGFGALRPVVLYVTGIAGASLIATAATAPLALAHFQQAPTFGVLANLAAMPVMAFLVMPAALLAGCLAPFGFEWLPLQAMAFGIELILAVARLVADIPGGVIRVPASSGWPVAAFLAGLAWIACLRGRVRWLGGIGALAALLGLALARPPDILVSGDGRLAAVLRDDVLYVSSDRRGRFEQNAWKRSTAASAISPMQDGGDGAAGWRRCDDRGCVLNLDGRIVAISLAPSGLSDDCREADLLIALHAARLSDAMDCAPDLAVIDGRSLAVNGGHAVRIEDDDFRVRTVREAQGPRLWSGWRQ